MIKSLRSILLNVWSSATYCTISSEDSLAFLHFCSRYTATADWQLRTNSKSVWQ